MRLIDELCAGISKGTSPDVALRDAKLAILHSDTAYKKPFYSGPLFRSFADRQRRLPQEQPVLETRGRPRRKRERKHGSSDPVSLEVSTKIVHGGNAVLTTLGNGAI